MSRSRPDEMGLVQIVANFGIRPMMLSKWLRKAAIADGDRPCETAEDAAESRALRRRVRVLEQENEVPQRAAAYVGRASLPKG